MFSSPVAGQQFGAGPIGSTLALRLRRDGVDVTVARGDSISEQFARPSIDRFDDGVYYIDLARASMTDINAVIDRLATASGVVFDLRGYPNSNGHVLSHLLTRPDDSTAWMTIPHVLRLDHASTAMPTWETFGLELPGSSRTSAVALRSSPAQERPATPNR